MCDNVQLDKDEIRLIIEAFDICWDYDYRWGDEDEQIITDLIHYLKGIQAK